MTVYVSIIGMETIGMAIVNDDQPFLMVCTGGTVWEFPDGLSYNPWRIEDYQAPAVGSIIAVITMFQRNYKGAIIPCFQETLS